MSAEMIPASSGEVQIKVSGLPTDQMARIKDIVKPSGELSAHDVLDDARDPSSPLHSRFEWDDSVAGEEYRLGQARDLIRRVKVTIIPAKKSEPIIVRAYIAKKDVDAGSTSGTYLPIEQVAGKTQYEIDVQARMRKDLEQLSRKYKDHELLFSIAEEIFGE